MTTPKTSIAVIGAGAWGTALAQTYAASGHPVALYAREAALAQQINATRQNGVYLPNSALHANICAAHDISCAEGAEIVLLATPAQFMRDMLKKLVPKLRKGALLVNCAKGIEISSGKLLFEVAAEVAPQFPYAVLSGPTFAHEVAKGLPAAATLAAKAPQDDVMRWAQTLSTLGFRLYASTDVAGAEVAGAVKNVIAIACGIVEGKALGQNAKAAVMTRGLAESRRLGISRGAQAETFLGLCGIGDLTLTCNSTSSRNYSVGLALGGGKTLDEIRAGQRSVAEGVATAQALAAHAGNVDMPICHAVDQILHKRADVDFIIRELLSRHLKPEGE